ncbi:MAG: formate dehydrogenase subunit gamma [Alphaproteobacteria bacterium]|nr:formate dehydrogenase subunit gamma [Alphaproteobacteria bacterium]
MTGHAKPVSRYTAVARINHWITAVSLILLALSGMALFHPSLYFLTYLFGGGQITRAVHPWIGVVLGVSFLGLFIRFFTLNFWNRDDTIWMKNLGSVINNKEEGLPELGKYNAGQKLVFWGQSILILLLLGSGFVLWDTYFASYTTIDQKRLSAVVHALCAIGAILIWIVHVYAAIWVKGTLSAMTRGSVSGGWAWKHHRKWFRQEVGKP